MSQGARAIPAPVKFTTLSKEYIHLGGTKFAGSESIVEAQQWLRRIERIITGLENSYYSYGYSQLLRAGWILSEIY